MLRTRFEAADCPLARAMDHVGEHWTLLILRDAFRGMTRFDAFQASLGIAPNMLARRLKALTGKGLLERRRYSEHPPRDDYVLTERGRDLFPVLASLGAWGNRHLSPGGDLVSVVDRTTGARLEPIVVDRATLAPIAAATATLVPGPAAAKSN